MGLPFVGGVNLVTNKNILTALDKIHDEYGGVVSVNVGPSPDKIVFIGDYRMLKEAFKDDKATGRFPGVWSQFRHGNVHQDCRGVLYSEGTEWTEQRRFALRRLRDFGLGKSSMEDSIQDEIRQLQELLDKHLNQPINMNKIFNLASVNALWTLLTGLRFSLEDPKLTELVSKIQELFSCSSLHLFPYLRHIAPNLIGKVSPIPLNMKTYSI